MRPHRKGSALRRILQLILVLAVAGGGLAWALAGVDASELREAIATYRWRWLGPGVAALALAFVFRTVRFWLLLEAEPRVGETLSVMAVGFLAITVVPLRMGELVRPYLLRTRHGIPLGRSAAAVILERLLDLLGLLAALGLVAAIVDVPRPLSIGGVDVIHAGRRLVSLGVALGAVGLCGLAVVGPRRLARLEPAPGSAWRAAVGHGVGLVISFTTALLALLRQPARALATLALTAGSWCGHFLAVAAIMAGFESFSVDFDRVLLNWTATQAAILVVPTPGFLGSFEAGSLGSLRLLGVAGEAARAYTVLLHTTFLGFIAVLGGGFLIRQGWSLANLVGESRRNHTPSGAQSSDTSSEDAPPFATTARNVSAHSGSRGPSTIRRNS